MNSEFISPEKPPGNMDRYLVRESILRHLLCERFRLTGILLDVGCGQMPYKKILLNNKTNISRYIGLDLPGNSIYGNNPDIFWESGRIPLDDCSVDSAICTEVLEHCHAPLSILVEISRCLKPGGTLFFTVPFLWPLHEVPFDHHRYTPFAVSQYLKSAGFTDVQLKATGGWDASLAQMIGLWARRRPMGSLMRAVLSRLIFPLYLWLVYSDRKHSLVTKFTEGQMITGLTGTAVKE